MDTNTESAARYFTAVYRLKPGESAEAFTRDPRFSAGMWGHAMNERDAARASGSAAPALSFAIEALEKCITDAPYSAGIGASNRVQDINKIACNAMRELGVDPGKPKSKRGPPNPARHSDDAAVDRFASAMKAKLAVKRRDGRGGWDDRETCSNAVLAKMLIDHIAKGDPVDIANFAMMIHQRDAQGIENGTIDNLPDGVRVIAFVAGSATPAPTTCVICGEDEPRTGSCGTSDPRALCNRSPVTRPAAGEMKLNTESVDSVESGGERPAAAIRGQR